MIDGKFYSQGFINRVTSDVVGPIIDRKRERMIKKKFGEYVVALQPNTYYFGNYLDALPSDYADLVSQNLRTDKDAIVESYYKRRGPVISVRTGPENDRPKVFAGETILTNPFSNPQNKLSIGMIEGKDLFYVDTEPRSNTFSIIKTKEIPREILVGLKKNQFIQLPYVVLYFNEKDGVYRLVDYLHGDTVLAEFSLF